MTSELELVSIRYQNVRGFYDATLPLVNEKTLIVGRNNAGKTSALLLLAWLINDADPERLGRYEELNEQERNLLLPARSARHRARRITLTVNIQDGKTARKFEADQNNNAMLRIGFHVSGTPTAFIQLGQAKRTSGSKSDPQAKELLSRIQAIYSVVHIPSARDAGSLQFQNRFRNLYRDRLAERALHPGKQSGSHSEYRQIVQVTKSLKKVAKTLLAPMLKDLAESLPPGLLVSPNLPFKEGTEQSVVAWIVEQVTLKLVTGKHDNIGVEPTDVGAGLQSVLDIAAASVILGEGKSEGNKKLVVAVEEPEAFLHPSLQRTIARTLLSEQYGYKTLVSTHSSILVEEAKYESLLLAVARTLRVPKREDDSRRCDIHTALLNGQGAEMIFASSVLLVEGEGDQVFFEGLRRRLAKRDRTGRVDNLFVVQVGSNARFGPWIKLLHALNGATATDSFTYLVAPDGDATNEVQRAFRDSTISIPQDARVKLENARHKFQQNDFTGWLTDLEMANNILSKSDPPVPLCFLEGDLEWAMFSGLSSDKCKELADSLGVEYKDRDKDAFIKKMGSKAIDGQVVHSAEKAPYMRKQIAEKIALSDLSLNVKSILLRWLTNAKFKPQEAEALFVEE